MSMFSALKRLPEQNIWISIGLASFGLFLLKFSDSSVIIKIIRWILPNLSSDSVRHILLSGGSLMLFAAFGTFVLWMNAFNKKRLDKRKLATQQAARDLNWNFIEHPPSHLRRQIDSLIEDRTFAIPPELTCKRRAFSNILSKETDGDLLIVCDIELHGADDYGESSFSYYETAFAVVSESLNLPYFQTELKNLFGDNAVANFLKRKGGITDIDFPHRPNFSKKYIVGGKQEEILNAFTPAVFDFYEQNQLYRTIGRDKMLCLLTPQIEPINEYQINQQLQILHRLFQLLKSK